MRRFIMGMLVALAGCGEAKMSAPEEAAMGAASDAASVEVAQEQYARAGEAPIAPSGAPPAEPAPTTTAPSGDGAAAPSQPGPSPTLYLAYSYQTGLEIPSTRLPALMDAHVQACQRAGPRLCQLIGSNRSGDPESYIEGYVSMRAEPRWLGAFMGALGAQADAAGGRVISQTTSTEDLTRQIVDTEARLRAQTALRDRLQELLRSRPGRLADLLEVERELARVQGDIDAVQSNLAVMRTRVAMSELTLSYRSAPRPVGSDTFEPLRDAFANFLKIVVGGFAAIITIIAGLLPFVIVAIPIIWGALRWRRARGGRFFRRAAAKPEGAPPPSPS